MPFSSDGDQIDFIYGVINWKRVDGTAQPNPTVTSVPAAEFAQDEVAAAAPFAKPSDEEAEEPLELTERLDGRSPFGTEAFPTEMTAGDPIRSGESELPSEVHPAWDDGPLSEEGLEIILPDFSLDENAGLADRLWAARETADSVKAGEGRTRTALYKALSLAYDFALAAQQNPDEYAELLDESGVKAQTRAPMTPIVKLVFGIDYDKARLTEFAAALSYAQRQEIGLGGFQKFIEKQPGGLKALVAAERLARRPGSRPDSKGEVARARLRTAPRISLGDVPEDEEFALVVTRRGADGTHEPVAIVADEALVERAIRRVV
jgi:hypothetical protein